MKRVKLTSLVIFALAFFNFILLMNNYKLLRKFSSLNYSDLDIILEENSLSGRKLNNAFVRLVEKQGDSSKYFLVLVFRKRDCDICLNYIISSLQKIKDVKVFGVYADSDTISMKKMVKIFQIKFPVIQDVGIVDVLSLKRTPFVLFINPKGVIIYAYYPNYLKPESWDKFLSKIKLLM
jgi:hypothetical protein